MRIRGQQHGRSVLATAAVSALLLAGAGAWMLHSRPSAPSQRLIVLGIDGMDPKLLRTFMARGEMPNFKKLAGQGGFTELATTFPPQSPVAWSTLITGQDPGGTGIFDFIHRDPQTLTPYLSTSRIDPPAHEISIGRWLLPLSSARPRLLREGKAFWQVLDDNGIDATVIRMPANFPPAPTRARTLAGMGTPDLLGGYGTFSFFTNDPFTQAGDVNGGRIYRVSVDGSRAAAVLEGPPNPFRRDHAVVAVPFSVFIDPDEPAARIDVQDQHVLLRQGEWSRWVHITFEMMPHLESVSAICRFYLKEAHPGFHLYVSPLNFDPERPPMPISTPPTVAAELARETGPFYTQGIAEDTKALSSGVLTEAEYLEQAHLVLADEMRLFEHELARFRQGLFFYYFSALDENAHVTWRSSPAALESLYIGLDGTLGKTMAAADAHTTILVVSDHGFGPFLRAFNVNAWLLERGYLATRATGSTAEFPGNIDWSRTKAYGLGLNGLYINQRGREAHGIVAPGAESDGLLAQLAGELLNVRDPVSGQPVLTRAETGQHLYGSAHLKTRPDLVLGYNSGYRAGWQTAVGNTGGAVLEDNNDAWSGDHCIDPRFVPGVLLASRPISAAHPALADVAPTILKEFGVSRPAEMRGTPVIAAASR